MLGINDKTFTVIGKIWLVLFIAGTVAGLAVQAVAYAAARRAQQLAEPQK